MESTEPSKITRPTSGAGLFNRLAKLCKQLRVAGSVPASGGGVEEEATVLRDEDGHTDDTEDGEENRSGKVHPQPCEPLDDLAVSELFALVSSLGSSYVQLQRAHTPYDPEKIQSADRSIVAKLQSLSEIKKSFLHSREGQQHPAARSLSSALEAQQCLLEGLQVRAQKKDSEILQLRWLLEELDLKNAEMEEEVGLSRCKSLLLVPLRQHLDLPSFSLVFESAAKSIHDFAKPLMSLMRASGWDLDAAAGSIGGAVAYAERSHKKYAFEAYLSSRMFGNGAAAGEVSCRPRDQGGSGVVAVDGVLRFEDPFDALVEDPDSSFARFCRAKYLAAVHPKMERSFFGNLDQRSFVAAGGHPRTPLYRAFAKMAVWVWVLRVMAASMAPGGEAFYVPRGWEFSGEHMESVVKLRVAGGWPGSWKVGLTVVPGFWFGESSVAKCRVYPTVTQESGH